LAIGFVVLLLTVWGALALWHQMPGPSVVRWFVIAMWSTLGVTVVLSRAGLLGRRNRNIAGFAFVIAAASLLMWWGRCSRHTSVYGLTMSPSCWRPGSTATMF
jgi:hypothetical protein